MEILAFIAELCQFCKHNTANKDLLRSKSISQRGIVSEDLSKLINYIESLEDCVDTIVPADLRFNQVSVGV
jgi:hypothetical protein